jgi:uncharacterized protein involved in exopolysaccharide biosynthesis
MADNQTGHEDGVDLVALMQGIRQWMQVAWAGRSLLLGTVTLAVAFGAIVAFGSTPEFTAYMKILPYRSPGAVSGISGLAAIAGVQLPSAPGAPIITAELYPDVVRTLEFRIAVAETPIGFSALGKPTSFVTYFTENSRPSIINLAAKYTIGIPRMLRTMLRPAAPAVTAPHGDVQRTVLPVYDREYLETVSLLEERLQIAIDKRTFVITMKGVMPDPYAAADLVRVGSNRLMERIIEHEARKAGEQLRFYEQQHLEKKVRYERTQRALAAFVDRNRILMSATAKIEQERLQREHDMAFDLFQYFSRELEQARIRKSQDTPVFAVLDPVAVPIDRSSPKRGIILILAAVVGVVAGMLLVVIRQLRYERGAGVDSSR